MENSENKAILQMISKTLIQEGVFAISNLEKGHSFSRSSLSKTLEQLTKKNILQQIGKKGSGVKYKLNKKEAGLKFLLNNIKQVNIEEIANAWGVGVASAKKYIKPFVDQRVVEKIGKPPKKINYTLTWQGNIYEYPEEERRLIEKRFVYITATGRIFKGLEGFENFVQEKYGAEHIQELATKYLQTEKNKFKKQYTGQPEEAANFIEIGTHLGNMFSQKYIRQAYALDVVENKIFGRTKLQQFIEIAKAGQSNTALMMEIVQEVQPALEWIIKDKEIEAIIFVPPTVLRKTQLMTFVKNRLNYEVPTVFVKKNDSLLPVQQKNLSTLKEKIKHAGASFQVKKNQQYKNILIIDDVLDSGATIQAIAQKLIAQEIAQRVFALTVTANVKI
jgi:predicted transcriptional regulator